VITLYEGDEFPMNFCPKSAKTRIIHPSTWNRISANFGELRYARL
jgi:hypothetical protein